MEPDPSLLRAIEEAANRDPSNAALRLHLAELLNSSGRHRDSLAQAEEALRLQPDLLGALYLAGVVGTELNDPRAAGWMNLYNALSADVPSTTSSAPLDPTMSSDGAATLDPEQAVPKEADWDAFLRDVLNEDARDRVTLSDVGGLGDIKEQLNRSFLIPLRNEELRRAYGAQLRGGLLLWGPPGCGKTFLAKAIAGELGAQFVPVGLHQVLDMWFGNSEKQVHDLFEMARRNGPCVLFFDEVDAIGLSRSKVGRGPSRNVVAQLLSELDGVSQSNDGVFVVGATNQPWDVDPALRRPGRFDRTMLVLPPDSEAREAIFRYNLRGRPVGEIDYSELAAATEGLSGADIRLVCIDAAERSLEAAYASSKVEPIGMEQFREAMKETKPSTTAWFDSARNHVRYANQSGEFDDLAEYLSRKGTRRGRGR